MLDWITTHYIEILGVISGLLFLYFEYKEDVRLWPLGIITAIFYIYIFYTSKFYADMGLQVYYLVISIYGWMAWVKRGTEDKEVKIRKASKSLLVKVISLSVLLWGILYFVLTSFTDSPLPLGDSFTSAFAITATWMLSRKILEQWLFWVVINFVSCGLYIYRGLHPTVLLFFVYSVISVAGYFEWNRKLKAEQKELNFE